VNVAPVIASAGVINAATGSAPNLTKEFLSEISNSAHSRGDRGAAITTAWWSGGPAV